MTDIERIVEGFSHLIINLIIIIPTYNTLAEINLRLDANEESVNSELGHFQLGLLALTFTASIYMILEGVAFVPPLNPLQVLIHLGLTGPQIAALQSSHSTAQNKSK